MKLRLNALRVNTGLTQDELAKKMGVSKETIGNWENYRNYPSVQQFNKLCKIFGCKMDDIFLPDELAESE